LTIVVSPLIALMQDQVDGLRLNGVPAAASHSNLSAEGRRELNQLINSGELRILFVAPERLFREDFLQWLTEQDVAAIAIDEAHCISQWGHDFRPEYRRISELRERFPGVPVQAYTATATPRVREDICEQLNLKDPAVLIGTFDRPELTYRVLPRQGLIDQVVEGIGRHGDTATIVYCISRKDTETLAKQLKSRKIEAEAYHAGLSAGERTRISSDFRAERLNVVCATVAFGMGIDRSDVRLVVHAAMPKSIEHYQQETGRAGRDGLPSECLLLYSGADAAKWRMIVQRGGEEYGDDETVQAQLALLNHMQRFAGRARCRHRSLSEYFGQDYNEPSCGACDVCLNELDLVPDSHVTAQKILSAVARTGQRYGASYVIDVLRGSKNEKVLQRGHNEIPTFGLLKDLPAMRLGNYIDQLIDEDVLVRTDGEYPVCCVARARSNCVRLRAGSTRSHVAAAVPLAQVSLANSTAPSKKSSIACAPCAASSPATSACRPTSCSPTRPSKSWPASARRPVPRCSTSRASALKRSIRSAHSSSKHCPNEIGRRGGNAGGLCLETRASRCSRSKWRVYAPAPDRHRRHDAAGRLIIVLIPGAM
jgi:ATP-dependent DNA helicase RecQ